MDRPTIVCLCGPSRFSQAYHEANLRETIAGRIVLSIGCDTTSDYDLALAGQLTGEDKLRLDALHLYKVMLADEVLFLNVGGYLGESSLAEHYVASNLGKPIRYLERPSTPNRYYIEAGRVGHARLHALRDAGVLPTELRSNRRAWFVEDGPPITLYT